MDSEGYVDIIDPVLPSGFLQVAFNLGSADWQFRSNGYFTKGPDLELLGQLKTPAHFKITGHNKALGISFHPHTAHYFLKDNSHVFTGKVINLDAIFGNKLQFIQEQLQEHTCWSERIRILETFLAKRISGNESHNKSEILRSILIHVSGNEINYSVSQMAKKAGYSERYLGQLFKDYIGLPPKDYLNILRFHRSLRYLHLSEISHSELAYACGYADQSHFIREFKKFTGVTPANYSQEKFPSTSLFL